MKNHQLPDDFHILGNLLFHELEKNPCDKRWATPLALNLGDYETLLAKLPWPFDCVRITAGYTDNPTDSPER